MSEERRYVYMRRTQSGNGVRMRDGEIVYVASIRSLEAFLHGDKEFVAFMRFPYRQIPNENAERNILYTYCDKCGAGRFFRKVGEDMWNRADNDRINRKDAKHIGHRLGDGNDIKQRRNSGDKPHRQGNASNGGGGSGVCDIQPFFV